MDSSTPSSPADEPTPAALQTPEAASRARRRPTRRDVAELAGVSPAVVSYVMNDGPRPVAAATRARVQGAIDLLGYRPNLLARSLKQNDSASIGLLVPDISNPFFAELALAVEELALERGQVLLVGNTLGLAERERQYIETFTARRVAGVVQVGVLDSATTATLAEAEIPGVALDRRVLPTAAGDLPFVGIDNRAAGQLATNHLIGHGHERIGCVAGPLELSVSVERVAGWRTALTAAGLAAPDDLIHHADFTPEGGAAAGQALLEAGCSAIFVSSDSQTSGLLAIARTMGRHVPRDLAVVGFDGTHSTRYSEPAMTVIRQPIEQMARLALDLIADLVTEPTDHLLDGELLIRSSCGCPYDPWAPDAR